MHTKHATQFSLEEHAAVAQLVERSPRNAEVPSSTLGGGSSYTSSKSMGYFVEKKNTRRQLSLVYPFNVVVEPPWVLSASGNTSGLHPEVGSSTLPGSTNLQ